MDISSEYPSDIKDTALDLILKAGRTNVIKVDIGHHVDGTRGLKVFREYLFPRLKGNGYGVKSGELTLATYRASCPDSGTYADSTIRINENGAFLELGSHLEPAQKPVLMDWFKNLKRQIEQK